MFQFNIQDSNFLPHVGCDVRITLPLGQCCVVVGENGIGKSSLAQRIYEQVPEGKASLIAQGELEHFYDRSLATLKMIFLEHCQDKIEIDFFERLWSESGLAAKGDRLLSHLSGGERQLLKIIVGVVGKHDLFILDEPSQFLDSEKRKLLREILEKLLVQNKSILLIEHDLEWPPAGLSVHKLSQVEGTIKEVGSWNT